MVEHALVRKGLMCEHAACRHLPRHKPRILNFSTASYFLLLFWATQRNVEHIRLLWWCPAKGSNGCFPGMQGFILAQATLQLETSSILLGKPISIARRKRAFERSTYEEVLNRNGVRQVEPLFTHQRGDGSFQLLYNTCPESDAHLDGASFESPPFYGCIGRLVSFSSEGKQIGGETTLDFRGLLAEARIVGYWNPLKEPVNGVHSLHDAIFAVWAQRCRTVDSTCECTEAKCRVSLETSTAKSAYLLFTNQTIFETYKGDRLCVDHQTDKTALNKNSSAKFTFWLVEHTGWVCGRADMHGSYLEFDEQHPNGIRVGSVFAVRLIDSDVEKFEVIRPVWTGARLDYSFGFNALLGGPAKQIDPVGATEKDTHYAFTIRARSFDVVKGVSESRCFGVILDSNFQETSRTSDEIFPCKPCVYAAFVLHPQYQELMAVCKGTTEELSGIYVDGKRLSRTQRSVLSLPPTEMSVPVFVPDDFRAWKVFWKDVTEVAGETRVTLNLGEWNQQLQLYFENLAPVEGIKATGVDLIFASFFGEDSLLVGYQDSMQRSTFLMECSSNGTRVPGNSLKVLRTAEASLLPPAPGAFITRPAASGEVFWYSLWTEDRLGHDAQDSFLPIADSTREIRLVKATGSRKNAGPCKGGVGPEPAACDASCHRLQVYETNKTVGADDDPTCVYTDGTNFAETCFDGSCQFLPVVVTERSTEITPDEQVDETLESQITPSSSQSVFEISLQNPAEIWAIRGFFVPHSYPEFTVTLLDTNRTIVYTLSTRLPALKYGNLTYWEWRDMQVYRIQYVQLQLAGNATRRENLLEVADVQIIGRELPVCPSEGFFSAAAPLCSYDVAFLLKDASVWDCQGEWSEWSYCDSTCRATRFMNVRKPALYGGRPCQLFEKRACSVGPHCHHINAAIHDFRQRRQDCIFATSEWSECRNCRRLRINHRIREAAGDTELGCPPFFEMENCPPPCDSELADWSITPATTSWWTRLWLMMADSWTFFAFAIIGCLIVGSGIVTVIYCRRTPITEESDQLGTSTPTFTRHQTRDEDVPLVDSGPASLTEGNLQERATITFSDDVTLLTESSASLGKHTV